MTSTREPSRSSPTRAHPEPQCARYVSAALGLWLCASALLWPHTRADFINTWVVGMLISGCALGALWYPALRRTNAILGLWLMGALVLWRSGPGTYWNHLLVGALVFVLATFDGAGDKTHCASSSVDRRPAKR